MPVKTAHRAAAATSISTSARNLSAWGSIDAKSMARPMKYGMAAWPSAATTPALKAIRRISVSGTASFSSALMVACRAPPNQCYDA